MQSLVAEGGRGGVTIEYQNLLQQTVDHFYSESLQNHKRYALCYIGWVFCYGLFTLACSNRHVDVRETFPIGLE